jgi:hypothetical protein
MLPFLAQLIWTERTGWVLFHSLWQFAAAALAAVVVQSALRRRTAACRYGALLGLMVVVFALPAAGDSAASGRRMREYEVKDCVRSEHAFAWAEPLPKNDARIFEISRHWRDRSKVLAALTSDRAQGEGCQEPLPFLSPDGQRTIWATYDPKEARLVRVGKAEAKDPDPTGEKDKKATEEAENRHYRALFEKFQTQVREVLRTDEDQDLPGLAEQFSRSIEGRLLYLRVIHVDRYARVAGVDTPAKTAALIDKPFSAWRVPIPKMREAFGAEPQVTRKAQDGGNYLLIENGRLKGGRYADDLAIMMAITLTKSEERPRGPAAVQKVITLLELPWQERIGDEKLDEAAASLKPLADRAVEEIMRSFNRSGQTFVFRHRAVQILQRLRTPKARSTLLNIALGRSAEDLPSMKQWASAAYLRTTQDHADVIKLLGSNEPGVLGNGLRALKGVKVDEALLKRLVELTTIKVTAEPMSQENVRLLAAAVLAADPRGKFPSQKVNAILAAIKEVADLPHAQKIQWHSSFTYAESSYFQYLRCLSEMPGADEILRQATGEAPPLVRDILVIARARRGDATSRKDLQRILDDQQAGIRRAWAVRALGVIGHQNDLPILRKLAASDPLERDRGGDVGPPGRSNTFFPVREAAQEVIRQLESRRGKSP